MEPELRVHHENATPLDLPAKNYAMSGKIMFSAIVILFTAVILILLLHIYTRWYLLRIRRRNRRQRLIFSEEHPDRHNLTSHGLDPALVKSLPVFIHSSVSGKDEVLECAVCLSEFQVNEKGRTLPGCKHSFHIECIDMWFYSHSTCPLCRSTVEYVVPLPVSESVRIDVAPEPSDRCESCRHAAEVPSASSSSSSSCADGGIRIEVPPRRMEEMGFEVRSPGGGQGFKSPRSRVGSLKRMLSKDSFRFRPGGGPPNDVDLEKDGEEERFHHRSPPQLR